MKPQKLPKISLKKLTHDELVVVVNRLIAEWGKRANIPPTIVILIEELTSRLDLLRRILKRERSSELTREIHELDKLRDRSYMLLVRSIKDSQDQFENELVVAGKRLLPIVENYGVEITAMGLTKESANIQEALGEFSKEEHADALETLGAMKHLNRTISFQSQFEIVWKKRNELGTPDDDLPLLRGVRLVMEQQLRIFLSVSEFLYNRGHDSIDDGLFSIIDNELTLIGTTIKSRQTQEQNAENSVS